MKRKLALMFTAFLCLAATAAAGHGHGGSKTLDGVSISGYHTHGEDWIHVTLFNSRGQDKDISGWKVTVYYGDTFGSSTFVSADNIRISGHGTKIAKIRWDGEDLKRIVLTDDNGGRITKQL